MGALGVRPDIGIEPGVPARGRPAGAGMVKSHAPTIGARSPIVCNLPNDGRRRPSMEAMSRSESLPTGRRVLRWVLWLAAGVLFGVAAGFLAGLGAAGTDQEPDEDEVAVARTPDLAGGEQ